MAYVFALLEGVAVFVSPCLLPMLPLYLSYFAGGREGGGRALKNACGFILGFTLFFLALGAFAGTIGGLLRAHATAVNLVTGGVVVLFGLHYLGVLHIGLLDRTRGGARVDVHNLGFFSSMLFGIAFITFSPCAGIFLGAALLQASQQGSALRGVALLLCYSLGLGIPFFISALLIERLKATFDAVKRHMDIVVRVSGALLVLIGITMMTGLMNRVFGLLGI